MKRIRALFLSAAIIETVLAIPVLGGLIIVGLLWVPLLLALAFHITTLVFAVEAKEKKLGSILGILANTIGIIPGVGMILHILAAVFNYVQTFSK